MSKTVYGQFVYLKESFCPSLDEKISVLYEVRSTCKPQYNNLAFCVWQCLVHVLCSNPCGLCGPAGLWERGSIDCQLRKRTCLGLITPGHNCPRHRGQGTKKGLRNYLGIEEWGH